MVATRRVQVRQHTRNGRTVRAHTRMIKTTTAGGLGGVALLIIVLVAVSLSSTPASKAVTSDASGADTGALHRVGSSDSMPCATHSYGLVQRFFRSHPCQALSRELFTTRDSQNDGILVAVSWTRMPDHAQAAALQQLADRSGTGNVTELSRDLATYRTTRFTGAHYTSDVNGSTTVIAEAETLDGGASSGSLDGAAQQGLEAQRN
jgi:hypothetical protein